MQLDSQEAEKNSIIAALEAEKSELVELQKNNESEIKVLREKADSSENLVCVFLFNLPFHQLQRKTNDLIFNILDMTFFIYRWGNLNKKSSVYWMKYRANNRLVICWGARCKKWRVSYSHLRILLRCQKKCKWMFKIGTFLSKSFLFLLQISLPYLTTDVML